MDATNSKVPHLSVVLILGISLVFGVIALNSTAWLVKHDEQTGVAEEYYSSMSDLLLWWEHFTLVLIYMAIFVSTVYSIAVLILIARPTCPNILFLTNVASSSAVFLFYLLAILFYGVGLAVVRNEKQYKYSEKKSEHNRRNFDSENFHREEIPANVDELRKLAFKKIIQKFAMTPGRSYYMLMNAMFVSLGAAISGALSFLASKRG